VPPLVVSNVRRSAYLLYCCWCVDSAFWVLGFDRCDTAQSESMIAGATSVDESGPVRCASVALFGSVHTLQHNARAMTGRWI